MTCAERHDLIRLGLIPYRPQGTQDAGYGLRLELRGCPECGSTLAVECPAPLVGVDGAPVRCCGFGCGHNAVAIVEDIGAVCPAHGGES